MRRLVGIAIIAGLFNVTVYSATKIYIINPYTETGIINPSLIVAQEYYGGTCLQRSAVNTGRPDAWRCEAGNLKLDPCFQNSNKLVCLSSPWKNKIAILEISTSLVRSPNQRVDTTQRPWGIEFSNGQRCLYLPQPTSMINKMSVTYQCSSYIYSGLGEIDRTTPTWKIAVYDANNKNTVMMDITSAWF